jgi:hypothetical protein
VAVSFIGGRNQRKPPANKDGREKKACKKVQVDIKMLKIIIANEDIYS